MQAYFGRHSSVTERRECPIRPQPEPGDVFIPKKSCWRCGEDARQEAMAKARRERARNRRRKTA